MAKIRNGHTTPTSKDYLFGNYYYARLSSRSKATSRLASARSKPWVVIAKLRKSHTVTTADWSYQLSYTYTTLRQDRRQITRWKELGCRHRVRHIVKRTKRCLNGVQPAAVFTLWRRPTYKTAHDPPHRIGRPWPGTSLAGYIEYLKPFNSTFKL